MSPKARNITIGIAALAIIAAGVGAYQIFGGNPVPKEFRESRERSGFIAERIVQNSASMVQNLERVNQLDKEKKYTEASALIDELTTKNKETRNDALELAKQLETMTKATQEIKDPAAQILAFEAVNNNIALITHLLKYNEYVGRLFDTLKSKFVQNKDTQVAGWIEQINYEVSEINAFDKKAREAFQKFDETIKQ